VQARAWANELRTLDEELAALLTGDGDIYRQAQAVNDLFDRAARLAQEVEIRQVRPPLPACGRCSRGPVWPILASRKPRLSG